jgi:hypothetical protein
MTCAVGLMRWVEWQCRVGIAGRLQRSRPKIGVGISMFMEDNEGLVPDFDFAAVEAGSTAVVAE